MTEQRMAELRELRDRARPLLAWEGRQATAELIAEVERCWKRINGLLRANNDEVERRRAVEYDLRIATDTAKIDIERLEEKIRAKHID